MSTDPHTQCFTAIDQQLFDLALTEDLGHPWRDATSDVLFAAYNPRCEARILCKHPMPVTWCGNAVTQTLLAKIDPQCQLVALYADGAEVAPGATLLQLTGPAASLLRIERTLLNYLRHLSAIATLTRAFVNQVKHTSLQILDTRKTTPGMRSLEKYAVMCGGGVNHRMGLYDAIMIKDTHVDLLGGMAATLAKLPETDLPVVIEVRDLVELDVVLTTGRDKVSRVLLDNMSLSMLQQAVKACQAARISTEASGNITLESIQRIAETGVDFASVGQLTHSAGQVDLSMSTQSQSARP